MEGLLYRKPRYNEFEGKRPKYSLYRGHGKLLICNTGNFCHAIQCSFRHPEVPRFEMQFIKHGCFQCQLFSLLSRRAAFVYCTKERHFQSAHLKLSLQHKSCTENCLCKQGSGLKRIKLCLLLWLGFFKAMKLLLSVRWDLSVRCREITLVLNRVQSADFR